MLSSLSTKGGGDVPPEEMTSASKVFTFEEEEERDIAIRLLQRVYRAKRAREHLKALVRDNYVKIYDKINSQFAYKNRTTGEVSPLKPVFLGDDDLPDPKMLECPVDYEPGIDWDDCDGCALVITVNKFKSEKLPGLGPAVSADHLAISELLSHNFIGKLRAENVIAVKNPTLSQFVDSVERCRRVVKKDSFLFVYICTHVVTVLKGEKTSVFGGVGAGAAAKPKAPKKGKKGSKSTKNAPPPPAPAAPAAVNKKEDCYFCVEDTVWKDVRSIASTSVPLYKLITMLNRMPCTKRAIVLNYAHTKIPKRSLFGNPKFLYPPQNFMFRLAEGTNCPVIGSCTFGMPLMDVIHHSPKYVEFKQKEAQEAAKKAEQEAQDAAALAASRGATMRLFSGGLFGGGAGKGSDAEKDSGAKAKGKDDGREGGKGEAKKVGKSGTGQRKAAGGTGSAAGKGGLAGAGEEPERVVTEADLVKELTAEFRALWRIPPDKKDIVSVKPKPPQPTYLKDESTNFKYEVHIPDEDEMGQYSVRLMYWRYRRLIEPPYNFFRRTIDYGRLKTLHAPNQTSLCMGDAYSLFGKGIIDALNGGAVIESSNHITMERLFKFVQQVVTSECGGLAIDTETKKPPLQSVVLVLPKNNPECINYPVCYRCGPPAAPERPFVVRVGENDVTLQWYNPMFDGVPAKKYKIYMRNISRCFNEWHPIAHKKDIETEKFTIRNLPAGVQCTFRVRAFNNGGWGMYSEETAMICPGEDQIPIPNHVRWKKLAMGGTLAIIDRLKLYPDHRHEYVTGLRKILAFALQNNGFHKGMAQIKVAELGIHALDKFPNDREISQVTFMLLAFSLMGPKERKARLHMTQNKITEKCDQNMEWFRCDTQVIAGITKLRDLMPLRVIKPTPEMKFEEEKPEESDDDTDDEQQKAPPPAKDQAAAAASASASASASTGASATGKKGMLK